MAVSENYPNLKANQAFQDLRVQLEGTENRITVARNRYIKAVADYNVLARQFPDQPHRDDVQLLGQADLHGRRTKPQISRPPAVNFDKPAPAARSEARPLARG